MHPDVRAYIDDAPEDHKPHLEYLCGLIEAEMPEAEVVMPNGFPVWTINGTWTAGFATRKKGVMLYLMIQEVLDKYEPVLGRLRSGRSCVAYKGSKTLPFEELQALAPTLYKEAHDAMRDA